MGVQPGRGGTGGYRQGANDMNEERDKDAALLVDAIADLIDEPIENGAADLGLKPDDLMDRVATEVKTRIAGWQE